MATPPIDPTMQIPSPELVKRIESLVSSLLGVTRSHVEQDRAGAIRSLYASVAPGHSPDRVRREIRSALLSSLDLDLPADVVEVEVEEQVGRRQEEFWQAPEPEADSGERTRRRPDTAGSEGPEELADPEDWLSRADSPGPRVRGRAEAPERRPPEDRRGGGDRGLEENRQTPDDRRSDEDRRSGEEDEIPSAAYLDAIIDRLKARERERGGVHPSAGGQGTGSTPDESVPYSRPSVGGARGPEEEVAPSGERVSGSERPPRRDRPPEVDPSPGAGGAAPEESSPHAEGSGRVESPVSRGPAPSDDSGRDRRSTGLLPLSLGEYVLLGGGPGNRGVELRIRVEAGGDRFVGTVRVPSLEDVSPGLFVGATLRAVEQALDAQPVSERSARILILEAVDMEEVVLREGRFVTATVRAVHRDGESRATGMAPADGTIVREAAAEAALDAVGRILQGRHTKRVEGRPRPIRREGEGVSHGSDSRSSGSAGSRSGAADRGSEPHDGEADRSGGAGRNLVGQGERGFTRDPFNIWE